MTVVIPDSTTDSLELIELNESLSEDLQCMSCENAQAAWRGSHAMEPSGRCIFFICTKCKEFLQGMARASGLVSKIPGLSMNIECTLCKTDPIDLNSVVFTPLS